jgi:hypothetical protein
MSITRRVHRFWPGWTVGLLILSVLLAGCTPVLDPERYGEVVDELPEIEGAKQPYLLPQLDKGGQPASLDKNSAHFPYFTDCTICAVEIACNLGSRTS